MTKPDPESALKAKALLDEFRDPQGHIDIHRNRADNLEIRIGQLISEAKESASGVR